MFPDELRAQLADLSADYQPVRYPDALPGGTLATHYGTLSPIVPCGPLRLRSREYLRRRGHEPITIEAEASGAGVLGSPQGPHHRALTRHGGQPSLRQAVSHT